jgi:hypothetical protein
MFHRSADFPRRNQRATVRAESSDVERKPQQRGHLLAVWGNQTAGFFYSRLE